MEKLGIIIGLVTALCTTGGVIYLIVQRAFDRKADNERVKRSQIEGKSQAVEYGIPMIAIYNEIDKIVESKTGPIKDKLDHALSRIDELETNWCCFRDPCEYRIRNRKDAPCAKPIKELYDETINHSCKGKAVSGK